MHALRDLVCHLLLYDLASIPRATQLVSWPIMLVLLTVCHYPNFTTLTLNSTPILLRQLVCSNIQYRTRGSSPLTLAPSCYHNMADQSQSSRFRVFFESALQDYQNQTGTTLVNHPLAEKLRNCNSVESVTAVLQEQARAFTEFRGGDDKIIKSLKSVVSVLYTLCASTAPGEAIGFVRPKVSIAHISDDLFYSLSHLQRRYSLPSPSFSLYDPCLFPTCTSL